MKMHHVYAQIGSAEHIVYDLIRGKRDVGTHVFGGDEAGGGKIQDKFFICHGFSFKFIFIFSWYCE